MLLDEAGAIHHCLHGRSMRADLEAVSSRCEVSVVTDNSRLVGNTARQRLSVSTRCPLPRRGEGDDLSQFNLRYGTISVRHGTIFKVIIMIIKIIKIIKIIILADNHDYHDYPAKLF